MTDPSEERTLLERFRAGDAAVAEEIVASFREPLVRFASGYVAVSLIIGGGLFLLWREAVQDRRERASATHYRR